MRKKSKTTKLLSLMIAMLMILSMTTVYADVEPKATQNKLYNTIVFIRFSDEAEFVTPAFVERMTELLDGKPGSNQPSLNGYFTEDTYGTIGAGGAMYPRKVVDGKLQYYSFQDNKPRGYYQAYNAVSNPIGYGAPEGTPGNDGVRESKRMKNLYSAAMEHIYGAKSGEQAPANSQFTWNDIQKYDFDSNGVIDNLAFIVSGNVDGWAEALWPCMGGFSFAYNFGEGKTMKATRYNLYLERKFWDFKDVVLMAHELSHTLGYPDLYPYSDQLFYPVGKWDPMDDALTFIPMNHLTYMKYMYGKYKGVPFLTKEDNMPEITKPGEYILYPQNKIDPKAANLQDRTAAYRITFPDIFPIKDSTGKELSNEYLMLEYRSKSGPYDSNVYGSGLVVYRVDEKGDNVDAGNSSLTNFEAYVYREGGQNYYNNDASKSYLDGTTRTSIGKPENGKNIDGSLFFQYHNSNPLIKNVNGVNSQVVINNVEIINKGKEDEHVKFNVEFNDKPEVTTDVRRNDAYSNTVNVYFDKTLQESAKFNDIKVTIDGTPMRFEAVINPENNKHLRITLNKADIKPGEIKVTIPADAVVGGYHKVANTEWTKSYTETSNVIRLNVGNRIYVNAPSRVQIVPTVNDKIAIKPFNGVTVPLVWTTTDQSIAGFTGSNDPIRGVVRGYKPGGVEISVTTENGTGQAKFTVEVLTKKIPVNSIVKNKGEKAVYNLKVGETAKINPQILDAEDKPLNNDPNYGQLVFFSANEKVATIDQNGTITAVGKGAVQILATTVYGGNYVPYEVVVK